jgi:diadenosine tetraphosphate (Ap4A) HIT family hydrolase
MHIHVVGRSANDPAWPGTVWASDAKEAYNEAQAAHIVVAARTALKLD